MIHRSLLQYSIACTVISLALSTTARTQSGTFVTIEGESLTGQLIALTDAEIRLNTKAGKERRIALDQLESFQAKGASRFSTTTDKGQRVWLRSGPVLAMQYKSGAAMRVSLEITGTKGPSSFPIPNLSAIQFQDTIEGDGGFARAIGNPSTTQDLVFLWNRERSKIVRLPTQVLGVSAEGFEISFRNREQMVSAGQLYGIVFGTENGIKATITELPSARVSLLDGPSLEGNILNWDKRTCQLRLAEGAVISLPSNKIALVEVQSSRVTFLSSLTPTRVEQVPAFDRTKAWLRDQSPRGKGIQLGGTKYRRGLCLIPRTVLDFELPGEFDTFEASLGIDDRSSTQAHAIIRIKVDGKVVFNADPFTLGMAPKVVRIPLAGIKTLTLETDFGKNFDLGDHCVFAGARLLKN